MARKRRYQDRGKNTSNKILTGFIGLILALAMLVLGLDLSGTMSVNEILDIFGLRSEETVALDNSKVSVSYIDVGQGDCSIIISGDDVILIDAGEPEYGDKVLFYLEQYGVEDIDYIIATHPHADHIGGLAEVIENYDVGTIYAPEIPDDLIPTSKTYEGFLEAVENKGLSITVPTMQEKVQVGVLEMTFYTATEKYDNLNDYSIVTKIAHGENTFLFTGDIEAARETDMLNDENIVHGELLTSVLKVAHHGSISSSTGPFLNDTLPLMAVISCGANNKYGHPNDEVVERINRNTDYIFRTDINGNIVAYSEDNEVQFSLEKGMEEFEGTVEW